NADFTRECRAIYAHAVYAERIMPHDEGAALRIARYGQETVLAALALCELIYDYGGTVINRLDELNAVLNADRVADPSWAPETARRLHERAGQLRSAGEPGLSKRIRRIISAKKSAVPLATLVSDPQPALSR
ncbi:hypothetical protein R5W24_002189, partial [Gemmata sp. JC717]|uniref:hypothetical protein n=1 Tax=Gemmata algarum TaxID=2975278 RepID=UPI0021BA909B